MDKILELFFEQPEKERHVREVAREIDVSPMTASKHLYKLAEQGLLEVKRERNHVIFTPAHNEKFKLEKSLWNIKRIKESGLANFLEKFYNHPKAIILFGSYSKGEDDSQSDVDIAIISPKKEKPELEEYEEKVKRKIHLIILTKEEIESMKNKELLNNLVNGIVISGYWEAFK